ncbi:hypothetical protein Tco_0668996 [Tanacetum coccineum]
MLIRGVSLLNSRLETECYLRHYFLGKELYDWQGKANTTICGVPFENRGSVGGGGWTGGLSAEVTLEAKLCPRHVSYVVPFKKILGRATLFGCICIEIEIDENLRFVEEPIEIVDRDVKKLKRRRIPLVKVRWNSRQGAEYTLGALRTNFNRKYPPLFS